MMAHSLVDGLSTLIVLIAVYLDYISALAAYPVLNFSSFATNSPNL